MENHMISKRKSKGEKMCFLHIVKEYEREKTWANGPNFDDFYISLWI